VFWLGASVFSCLALWPSARGIDPLPNERTTLDPSPFRIFVVVVFLGAPFKKTRTRPSRAPRARGVHAPTARASIHGLCSLRVQRVHEPGLVSWVGLLAGLGSYPLGVD
jgi:hypothetical protein